METSSLRKALADWTDWDYAGFALGICMGLMGPTQFGAVKHVFWSDHPVGNMLMLMLDMMVEDGILERRKEPDIQYRWNERFAKSWPDA